VPKPLTQKERAQLKQNLLGDITNTPQPPPANPHFFIVANREELALPSVQCTISLSAVDHEDPMPQQYLPKVMALWDTGAQVNFITDDLFSPEFREFVKQHEVHEPYRFVGRAGGAGGTRVQLSCLVEFSNEIVVQLDTVATVLSRDAAPNGRSGVILGQQGMIDSVRYESIPRAMAVMEGIEIAEDQWGIFDLKCYRGVDGDLRRC